MRYDCRLALTAGLVCVMARTAWAESESAAVVSLLTVNLSVEEADALTARLAEALTMVRGTVVRGGRPVRRLLPEEGLPADCAVSEACIRAVQSSVEAEALVFVVVTRLGTEVQVDPTVVVAGRAEARPAVRGTWAESARRSWWADRVGGWLPRPSGSASVAVTEEPGWKTPAWPELTLAGLSVVSAAVGVGFGVSAQAKSNELVDDGCLDRPCARADIDRVSDRARVADVFYIVSGVTAVAAVFTYFLFDEEPAVSIGMGPTGVAVEARF